MKILLFAMVDNDVFFDCFIMQLNKEAILYGWRGPGQGPIADDDA